MSISQDNHASGNSGAADNVSEFVTVTIADQLFGIPVMSVQDVLRPQRITRIPLAPPEVAGTLNLRGRIVTAIDVRRRLGIPPMENEAKSNCVVVDFNGELYSLSVDSVGEVLSLSIDTFEPSPPTLDPAWRSVSAGIYRLEEQLMVVLDVERFLDIGAAKAA